MKIELLLEDFCNYSRFIKGYSELTINRYQQNFRLFSKSFNIVNVQDVSEDKVRQFFMEGRSQKHWKATTYITYHKSLHVFFRWCVKQGHLKKNFAEDVELPKLERRMPKGLKKRDAFYILEIAYNMPYVQNFLRYRNHAIYSTFLYTGIRKQELLNLKLTDIDIENKTLFIKQGKGNKDRILPLHFQLILSLERYLLERKKTKKMTPYFFTSSNRDMGFTDSGLKRLNNKIKKVSKLSFTIHSLRHTFATLMLEGGCDIYSLSKMLGHSDIKTTTIYLSASAEHLREQMIKHPLESIV